jgi:hypothetical protein
MSGVFTYDTDGTRIPFDPQTVRPTGCILCGRRRIAVVGIFIPATDDMRAVVLKLRRHPIQSTTKWSGIVYGLCRRCMQYPDAADRVEMALEAAAQKVVLQ